MHRGSLLLFCASLALAVSCARLAEAASPTAGSESTTTAFVAEKDRAWTALFDRTEGWTGADGIYSIPLSGSESPGASTPTLFLFSDTFIGTVGEDGRRQAGTTLVNNTLALLQPSEPEPENIEFFWGRDASGAPRAVFAPGTPASSPGDWYWLEDGLSLNGEIQLFALRMTSGDGGDFNFEIAGVSRITLPLDAANPIEDQVQADTPLYFRSADVTYEYESFFGGAVMPNTAEAAAPAPDGYVYVYGVRSNRQTSEKKLIAARVPPGSFGSFEAWRYWDGTGWSGLPTDAAPVQGANGLSAEFSVTPLPDGRYLLTYQRFGLADETVVRSGSSPIGPFGSPTIVWTCPEANFDPDIFCYNAKAHPHLSAPGELLISYNVNTLQGTDHIWADIYRPRFVRVRLTQTTR